jgi:hypothetical protein
VILDPQALRLAQWFAGLQERLGQLVEDRLHGACALQLEQVTHTLEGAAEVVGQPAQPQSPITLPPGTSTSLLSDDAGDASLASDTSDPDPSLEDRLLAFLGAEQPLRSLTPTLNPPERSEARGWKSALEHRIRPALHRARGTLRAAAASFTDGTALDSLRAEVDETLVHQPEQLSFDIRPEDSSVVTPDAPPTRVEVPMRRWLLETLKPPLLATISEFGERIAAAVNGATTELERIETVLDYHLFIVEDGRIAEDRDESARTGLGHGVRLVQQLAGRLDGEVARAYRWFIAESSMHMDDALAPLRAHRPEEITQTLTALAQRRTPPWWKNTGLGRLRRGATDVYGKAAPLVREVVRDVRGLLRGDQPRLGYWDLAIASDLAPDDRLPPLYYRLFGEIPLGLADLYQPDPRSRPPAAGSSRHGSRDSHAAPSSAAPCWSPATAARASAPSSTACAPSCTASCRFAGSRSARIWPARPA